MDRRLDLTASTWPGCHGVELRGAPFDLGAAAGDPLTNATLRVGQVAAADGQRLWNQHGEAFDGRQTVVIDRALFRRDDGRYVVASTRGPALEVDLDNRLITIADGDESVQRQLLASFAIPLLLRDAPVLLVHGSACARDGNAVIVCADSGSGKSSVFVHLLDDGWHAVSEDLCVIDLRASQPRVWPGPPWVRIMRGERGPAAARLDFESGDKVGWDVRGAQVATATDLAHLVLLEAPGGEVVTYEALRREDTLRALARHAVWLEAPSERGRRLFDPVVAVAARVPAARLQLPRRDAWRSELPDLIAVT